MILTQKEYQPTSKEERFELAVKGAMDGVWDWNAITGQTYYSDQSLRMLGYQADEVSFTSCWWDEKVHPEDKHRYFDEMQRHLVGENDNYRLEYRIQHKAGHYIWVLDRGQVVERNPQFKPSRITGTHTDISQRKEEELALRSYIDIIAEQNKRLQNFAHIVSHNLRNYTGNLGMSIDLYQQAELPSEQEEAMQLIQQISRSLSETIEDLQKIVAVQVSSQKQTEELDLAIFIEQNLQLLRGEILAKEATIVNHVDSPTWVKHLPAYLDSIVLNLLSNALKYSDPHRKPVITLFTSRKEGQLRLHIEDNGEGIDLERYGAHLFGLYQKFHGNKDANGVGLFITKNQIETLGGSISVVSEVGKGSIFTVTFASNSEV